MVKAGSNPVRVAIALLEALQRIAFTTPSLVIKDASACLSLEQRLFKLG
jgi:hypothetical protein